MFHSWTSPVLEVWEISVFFSPCELNIYMLFLLPFINNCYCCLFASLLSATWTTLKCYVMLEHDQQNVLRGLSQYLQQWKLTDLNLKVSKWKKKVVVVKLRNICKYLTAWKRWMVPGACTYMTYEDLLFVLCYSYQAILTMRNPTEDCLISFILPMILNHTGVVDWLTATTPTGCATAAVSAMEKL